MKSVSLNGAWEGLGIAPDGKRLRFSGEVPGFVHTDLLRAGEIKDPFWRYNADECQWIEGWSWSYRRAFTLGEAPSGARLEFDGLDTYCDVFLNGHRVGSADDMFIPHVFPAQRWLKTGENVVEVAFDSPVARTNGRPDRGAAFTSERLYTRRMQCTYSWDWVNRFVTCGVFRDVRLAIPNPVELSDTYVATRHLDSYGAQLQIDMNFDVRAEGAYARLTIESPTGETVFSKRRLIVEERMRERVDVASPALWWPSGYGEQPLYTLTVEIELGGATLSRSIRRFGIRTARILQLPDAPGSPNREKCLALKKGAHVSGENAFWDRNEPEDFAGFALLINGERVFCQGANWVPCDPFPSRESPEKIEALLKLAREGGANMLRVWGGGLFERDEFYDACDQLGLMLTQDFLMACGNYPEDDEDFLDHLRAEARHAALRLRNHPSLVWWTGDNENAMGADENMADHPGRKAALRAIGPVLESLDPLRDFLPASPVGGTPNGSITRGTTHNTNYMSTMFSAIRFGDLSDYNRVFDEYLSRFCAEAPTMGAPCASSLRLFMTEDDIFGENDDIWRYHTKNNPSETFREFQIFDYLKAIAEKLFGPFQDGYDRLFKLQYAQYEWVRSGMELYRRNAWFSSGLIYWMLNDCWPASGWSHIDYYGVPKAAWYAFKHRAKRVIGCVSGEGETWRASACVHGLADAEGDYRLFVQRFDGTQINVALGRFRAAANGVTEIASAPKRADDGEGILILELTGEGFFDRAIRFEKRPCDLRFPKTAVRARRTAENEIELTSDKYVHAVALDGRCAFSDNYFSLLPGETRVISCAPAFGGREVGRLDIRWLGMTGPAIEVLP